MNIEFLEAAQNELDEAFNWFDPDQRHAEKRAYYL